MPYKLKGRKKKKKKRIEGKWKNVLCVCWPRKDVWPGTQSTGPKRKKKYVND